MPSICALFLLSLYFSYYFLYRMFWVVSVFHHPPILNPFKQLMGAEGLCRAVSVEGEFGVHMLRHK